MDYIDRNKPETLSSTEGLLFRLIFLAFLNKIILTGIETL